MRPLDFVRTPKGNIALITETNSHGLQASISFIGKQNRDNEKNAWWDEKELEVIDTLPHLIAVNMCHPFGRGREDVEEYYSRKEKA